GYHSGGTINIITKSGSNDLHFSAFEFFRTDALNAAGRFETLAGAGKSDFRNNQFGAIVSGPILKDKMFFLGNYEGQRLHAGTPEFTNVPTAAQRAGIFRNPFTGQDVQLNVDPVAANILNKYFPLPNVSSEFGNFFSSPLQTVRNDFALVKV